MISAGTVFAQLAIMLAAGLIISTLCRRFHFPELLFLLGFGWILANLENGASFPVAFPPITVQVIGIVAIALVTFEGAKDLNLSKLTSQSIKSFQLIFLMTCLGTLVFGWLLQSIAGLSWPTALILAAATTGQSQLFLIMAKEKTGRVFDFLRLESVLNPGLDIIIPLLIVDLAFNGKRLAFSQAMVFNQVLNLALLFAVGIGAGVMVALVVHHLFSKAYYRVSSHLGLITSILASYALAEAINGSGIIASLTLGVAFANVRFVHRDEMFQSVEVFSRLMSLLLPIMLGTLITTAFSVEFMLLSLFTFCVLLALRLLAVSMVFRKGLSFSEKVFMTLAFPKGMVLIVVSAVLATLPAAGARFAFDLAVSYLVYSIALASVVTQGSGWFVGSRIRKAQG